jgi:hypothetical protein
VNKISLPRNYVARLQVGFAFGMALWWSRISANSSSVKIFLLVLILGFVISYLMSRLQRRSININSRALLDIEAEPDVSWRVLYGDGDVFEEGRGRAQVLVPVTQFQKRSNLMISQFVPENWGKKFDQSRFLGFKPIMGFNYMVEAVNEDDAFSCEIRLAHFVERGQSGEGIRGVLFVNLFVLSPTYISRHWIWPDWFEIFAHQDGES